MRRSNKYWEPEQERRTNTSFFGIISFWELPHSKASLADGTDEGTIWCYNVLIQNYSKRKQMKTFSEIQNWIFLSPNCVSRPKSHQFEGIVHNLFSLFKSHILGYDGVWYSSFWSYPKIWDIKKENNCELFCQVNIVLDKQTFWLIDQTPGTPGYKRQRL